MAGKDGKLTIELLLQTLIDLDKPALKKELEKSAGDMQKIIDSTFGDESVNIRITPDIPMEEVIRSVSKYARVMNNVQAEIAKAREKAVRSDKTRLNQELLIVEAQKEGIAAAKSAVKYIDQNALLSNAPRELRNTVTALRADVAAGTKELGKLERQLKASLAKADAREELGKILTETKHLGRLRKVSAEEEAKYTDAELLKRKRLLEDAKKYYKLLGGDRGLRGEARAEARLKTLKGYEATLAKIKKYSGEDLPVISDDEVATKQQLRTLNNRKKLAESILQDTDQLSDERKRFFSDEVAHIDDIVAKNSRLNDKLTARTLAARRAQDTDEKLAKDLYESQVKLENRRKAQTVGGKSAEARYTAELKNQLGILEAQLLRVKQLDSASGKRILDQQTAVYSELEEKRQAEAQAKLGKAEAKRAKAKAAREKSAIEREETSALRQKAAVKEKARIATLQADQRARDQAADLKFEREAAKLDAKRVARRIAAEEGPIRRLERIAKVKDDQRIKKAKALRRLEAAEARKAAVGGYAGSSEIGKLELYRDALRDVSVAATNLAKEEDRASGSIRRANEDRAASAKSALYEANQALARAKAGPTKESKPKKTDAEKTAEKAAAKIASHQATVDALDRQIADIESRKLSARSIAGIGDPAELAQVRKEIQEQNKALADQDRQIARNGGVASRGLKERRTLQEENNRLLDEASRRMTRLTGGWAGLNNTAKQFFRYAVAYGGMYELISAFSILGRAVVQLDADLKNLQAVTAATESDMISMSGAIKQVALTTRFSAQEISQAATLLGQAGVAPENMKEVLQATANFASAVGGSIETAADLITTFRQVYGELSETGIADLLTKAVNISKLTSEDLKTVVSISAQTAQDMGLSAQQYLGAVTTLRNAGIKASTVSTGMRQLMIDIFSANSSSLKQLEKRYAQLNEPLTQSQIKQRFFGYSQSSNPLLNALQELQRIGVSSDAKGQFGRLFEVRSMNVLRALIDNLGELRQNEAELGFGGAAAEAAAIQMQALQAKITNVGAALTFFAEELTRGPVSALKELADSTLEAIKYLGELDLTLKATGKSGLSDDVSTGALVGTLLGAVAPGGLVKKIGVGLLGGAGATAVGVGQADEGADNLDLTGAALTAAAVGLSAKGLGGLATGAARGILALFGPIGIALGALITAVGAIKVFKLEDLVGEAANGFVSFADKAKDSLTGLIGKLLGFETPSPEELELERGKESARASRQKVENRIAENQAKFDPYKQYDLDGSAGIGKVAADLEKAFIERNLRINRFLAEVDSEVSRQAIDPVLEEFVGNKRARVADSSENLQYLKKISDAIGFSGDLTVEQERYLSGLLNEYDSLNKTTKAANDAIKKERLALSKLSDQEKLDSGLDLLDDLFEEQFSDAQSKVLDGYGASTEEVLSYLTPFAEAASDRAEARLKEENEAVVTYKDSLGQKAKEQAIEIIAQLHNDGHTDQAKEQMRQLFESQRKYYEDTKVLSDELARMFREATARLPSAQGIGPQESGVPSVPGTYTGSRTSLRDPSGRYVEGEDFSDILADAKISERLKAEYASIIELTGRTSDISTRVIASIIEAESRFRHDALSLRGAGGIAQFMPATAVQYKVHDVNDPNQAIPGLGRYVADLRRQSDGNIAQAIASYNSGPGNTRKYGGIAPFKETRDYAAKIVARVGGASQSEAAAFGDDAAAKRNVIGPAEEVERLQAQLEADIEKNNKTVIANISQTRAALSPDDENYDPEAYRLISQSARDELEKVRASTDDDVSALVEVTETGIKVTRATQSAIDEYSAQAAEITRKRDEAQAIAEKLDAQKRAAEVSRLKAELADVKLRGGTPGEYAAVRSRITGFEAASLSEEQRRLDEGLDTATGGDESVVAQAKLDAKKAEIQSKELIAIRKYTDQYNKKNNKILKSQSDRAVAEALLAAESAILKGDYEASSEFTKQALEAQKAADAATLESISRISDVNEREEALAAFKVRETEATQIIVDLLEARADKLADSLKTQLDVGAASQEEAQEFARQEAAGEAVPREEEARRLGVQIEANNQLVEDRKTALEAIQQLLTNTNLTQADQNFLLGVEKDTQEEINDILERRAGLAGERKASVGGVAQVASTFEGQAVEQIDNLEESIGGTLVGSVNELGAAFINAGISGESMGKALKNVFHQMFLQIATAVTQALLLKAVLGAFSFLGGAQKGGVVPGGLKFPTGSVGGGAFGFEEGGVIAGNPGVDTTPGAIIHPSGARSPILVTRREAILPAGMVNQLGPGNVQASIDRFNSTGVARFANGGVVSNSYAKQSSSQSAPAAPAAATDIKIVNVPGNSVVEDYLQSTDGQRVVLNVLEMNPTRARQVLQG